MVLRGAFSLIVTSQVMKTMRILGGFAREARLFEATMVL